MTAMVGYKKMLQSVLELKKQGLERLHQRVHLLVTVFEDPEFRVNGADDFALADILNAYVNDCALTFLELRCVFQAFPNGDAWVTSKSLKQMYAEAYDKQHHRSQSDRVSRTSGTITAEQHKQAEKELEQRRHTAVVSQMRDELTELREENSRLKAENEQLRARVRELEGEAKVRRWVSSERKVTLK